MLDLQTVNEKLRINLTQEQYDQLALLDACNKEYEAFQILSLLKVLQLI